MAEALALRRWALATLSGGTAPPPSAGAAGWRLFLTAERCAIALRGALGAGPLPAPLAQAFGQEMLRVQSLLAMLSEAACALAHAGAHGVALKGAAQLLQGTHAVDVADLDLLVRPQLADSVAAALEERGLLQADHAPRALPVEAPGGWEHAVRAAPGNIPVEVHVDIPFLPRELDPWANLRPTRRPQISLLSAPLHLWHLLVHGVEHHPDRRGVLRELLLVRDAARACSADEYALVLDQVQRHPLGEQLRRMLEAARSPHWCGDLYATEAALRYQLLLHDGDRRRSRRSRWLWPAAFALLAGGGEYRRLWFGRARSVWGKGDPGRLGVATVPARFLWRAALLASVTPAALLAARSARRLTRLA